MTMDLATADALWNKHLQGCTQCNFDLDCRMCEGGYPDAEDTPEMHSCNCIKGVDNNGAHLQRLTTLHLRRQEKQAEYEARRQLIDAATLTIVAFAHTQVTQYSLSLQEAQSMANDVANTIVRQAWS